MRKRRLPLVDSPNWTPLDDLHLLVCAQTGDRRLADRDLTDAMASGRVRSMRRRIAPRADKPERELLLPSFWADYKFDGPSDIEACDGEQRLLVVERDLPPAWPLLPLKMGLRDVPFRFYGFYAWEPDCKKIFRLGVALEDTRESGQEKLAKQGRPQTIEWQKLREEIVRRCWQKGRCISPESLTLLITDLQAWHKSKFKNEPNYEDLRKFVSNGIAFLKLAGK